MQGHAERLPGWRKIAAPRTREQPWKGVHKWTWVFSKHDTRYIVRWIIEYLMSVTRTGMVVGVVVFMVVAVIVPI